MTVIAAVTRNRTRLILVGAAVLLSLGMGLHQSLGLFLTPVTRDLALTAADFTLAVAVQNIVWGLSQAPVGAIADRFGLRVTMVAGGSAKRAGFTRLPVEVIPHERRAAFLDALNELPDHD